MQNELANRSRAALRPGLENLARFAREADKPTCPRCPTCDVRVPDDIKRSGAGQADLGAAQESKQPSSHDGREPGAAEQDRNLRNVLKMTPQTIVSREAPRMASGV